MSKESTTVSSATNPVLIPPEEAIHSNSADVLIAAATDPALTLDLALALLKRRDLPAQVVEQLGKNSGLMKSRKLKPIPLTGQDATPQGVQYILAGWQSGTVYKAVKAEAAAAAKAAIAVLKGKKVKTNGAVNNKVRNVPSVLLTPVWVTKANYTILFKDGFLKRTDVCKGIYKKYCK